VSLPRAHFRHNWRGKGDSPRRGSPPFPRVRSVPGEGLEPSRGKPSQDFKLCAFSCRFPESHAAVSSETSGRSNRHQGNGLMISSELFLGLFTKVEIG